MILRVAHLFILIASVTLGGMGAAVVSAGANATEPVADIAGAADHPLAKRYEGSFIVSFDKYRFIDWRLPLSPLVADKDDDKRDPMNNRVFAPEKMLELEGQLTRIAYVMPRERTPLEVLRNYQDVVEAEGGEVLFECKREECGGDDTVAASGGGGRMSLTMYFLHEADLNDEPYSNGACVLTNGINDQRFFAARVPVEGGDAYLAVQTFQMTDDDYCKALNGRTVALVQVMEPRQREKKMVLVEAKEMADTLASQGSISLYGIYFDTDKTDLKPESAPTLAEIAKLMSAAPGMGVLVVGHTDNQGTFDYNLDLSSRRAQAVKAALVGQYGIEGGRLTTAGAGMMAPVASNDDEAGRAKNRRVVLVKAN